MPLRKVNYVCVDVPDLYWDYSEGPFGPAHWSELSPSWKTCGAGQSQSPIDIDTGKLKYDKHLDVPAVHDYQDTEASVVNTGHSVQVWTLSLIMCARPSRGLV